MTDALKIPARPSHKTTHDNGFLVAPEFPNNRRWQCRPDDRLEALLTSTRRLIGSASLSGWDGSSAMVAAEPLALHKGPMHGRIRVVQKSAILDQFGIEAAVIAVINLLGHQPVKHGTDRGDGVSGVNGERGIRWRRRMPTSAEPKMQS